MTISVLAVLFLIGIIAVSFFGFKAIIRQGKVPEDIHREKCTLCRVTYNKAQLVERQVGDARLYYFCASCIASLQSELTSKN
jgi:hypothetical protein